MQVLHFLPLQISDTCVSFLGACLVSPLSALMAAGGTGFFAMFSWLPVLVQNMLSGTALVNSTSSGLAPSNRAHTPTKAIMLTVIPSFTAAVAMLLVAWHSDRVNEKALHVAVPYIIGGVVLACYTPMASISFVAGFVNIVIALTAANAAIGVISSRVVGEFTLV